MTLTNKQNAMTKIFDMVAVTLVAVSLTNSMILPGVAKATETNTPALEVIAAPEPITIPERIVKKKMVVVATAYSSEAAQTDSTPCIPAMWKFDLCANFAKTGIEDTIAANFLPLGTEVRFPDLYGDKVFIVRDRMNSKYNGKSRIDFWKSTKPSAIKFGAQRINMEVLEKQK